MVASWPIVSGPSGPSWLINLPTETNIHDGPWLESTYIQDGYLDFMYSEHARDILGTEIAEYARFRWNNGDPTPITRITGGTCLSTGKLCPNHSTGGGFFAGSGTTNSPIYFTTSQDSSRVSNYIDTLVSTNDGASWHDYAQTARGNWSYPFAISGTFMVGPAGEVMGAFTDENAAHSTGRWPNNEALIFVHTAWR